MDQSPRKSIDAELKRAAWTYGKAGLLVDDSPECGIRVARSLYGCASLPPWWRIVRSIDCACHGIDAMVSVLRDTGFKKFRGIVIIDRYLPLTCAGGRAVPWSGSDIGEVGEEGWEQVKLLRDSVEQLRHLCVKQPSESPSIRENPGCLARFVTSFPVISPRGTSSSAIPWQQRTIEFLQQERRSFRDPSEWGCLLRFGPESSARIVSTDETPPSGLMSQVKIDEARWKAWTWDENLDSIVRAFKAHEPVILLTGAGSSLFDLPLSPGMPTTDEILERVCFDVAGVRPEPKPLETRGTVCTCEMPDAPEVPRTLSWDKKYGSPIAWLIEEARKPGGVRKLKWKLEQLCSTEYNRTTDPKDFKSFHRTFCRQLYRKDYGFPYHHWLMARLPWSAIVTTNFDGFHERAAASVARIPWLDYDERKRVLCLGTDATLDNSSEGLLFKPYGSLYSPTGELALGEKQIYNFFQDKFREALTRACATRNVKDKGVLVVAGHSMRDRSIANVLTKMKKKLLQGFQLLWVDPASFSCRPGKKAEGNVWEAWMHEAKERREKENKERLAEETIDTKERSGPVPATALEFVFDLLMRYQSH